MLSKNKIKYIHSLEMKKRRTEDGVFVAEGRKLVAELLPHFSPVYVAATAEWFEKYAELQGFLPAEVDVVSEEELRRASLQESPQGVIAVLQQRTETLPLADVASRELCLMLDDVQNPGNLGTIVRIADWFGIQNVYCSQGTADVYNPKTVQATMGSIARVGVHYVDLPTALDSLRALHTDVPVYGTLLDAPSIYDASLSQHGVIVMGNEGNGVSPAVRNRISQPLFIPPYPKGCSTAESLNVAVATAIVCAEFRRRG